MTRADAISAIPTTYKGVEMRSRSEAKFARWCDRHRVKWLYEPEGYDLDGVWYVPDFYLPELRRFVEVKPLTFAAETHKIKRMAAMKQFAFHHFSIVDPSLIEATEEERGAGWIESESACSHGLSRRFWDEEIAWKQCVDTPISWAFSDIRVEPRQYSLAKMRGRWRRDGNRFWMNFWTGNDLDGILVHAWRGRWQVTVVHGGGGGDLGSFPSWCEAGDRCPLPPLAEYFIVGMLEEYAPHFLDEFDPLNKEDCIQ